MKIITYIINPRQKLRWATSRGGPELPKEVIDFLRPLDLCYIGNYFKVEKKSKGKIAFFRLRNSAPDRTSTNLVATCCNTTMLIEHPLWDIDWISQPFKAEYQKKLMAQSDLVTEANLWCYSRTSSEMDWRLTSRKARHCMPESVIRLFLMTRRSQWRTTWYDMNNIEWYSDSVLHNQNCQIRNLSDENQHYVISTPITGQILWEVEQGFRWWPQAVREICQLHACSSSRSRRGVHQLSKAPDPGRGRDHRPWACRGKGDRVKLWW